MARVGILTVSTMAARGERTTDASGDAIAAFLAADMPGATLERRATLADDRAAISALLRAWADAGDLDLILTTGGTGLAPTDLTPEATLDVLERQAPGLAEAMRFGTAAHTPLAWLSRAVAGTRGGTLIINLPGSPKAVRECLAALTPMLAHALDIQSERVRQHEPQSPA